MQLNDILTAIGVVAIGCSSILYTCLWSCNDERTHQLLWLL